MDTASSTPVWSRGNVFVACLVFVLALGFHAWGATRGWYQPNLIGCEFRQTQTALSALFIQRDHNFSLAYPTPVVGAPWSIPLEFPLYQWSVVGVSNATGMALIQAGRTVSLICFYLALPALYLLLAQLNLNPSRRLLVLAFVLSCPLYVFYAQSFLIETMSWMFGLWFLLGFVRATERRTGAWWLLAAVGGSGAALVKVTTFAFFLLPAAAWIGFLFWQERPTRRQSSWRPWLGIVGQALASLALPVLLAGLWIRHADAIKAQSVGGAFLTSARERGYIFGIGVRFSWEYWQQHFVILFREIASWPVQTATLVILIATRAYGRLAITLVACFFAVQVVFPILYAWHEYYYVTNAFLLMVVIGLAANALLRSRLHRGAAWVIVLGLLGVQAWTFGRVHYPILTDPHPRENVRSTVLNLVTQPDDVVVVAGDDWSSLIPFYSERRCAMVRFEDEHNIEFLKKYFAAQVGQPVTALFLVGKARLNQPLIDLALQQFHLDPRPVLRANEQVIYLTPERRRAAMANFDNFPPTVGFDLTPESALDPARYNERELIVNQLPARPRQYFRSMNPTPWKVWAQWGLAEVDYEGEYRFLGSPTAKLWFQIAPDQREISVTAACAILPGAYAENVAPGDRTDGVDFILSEVLPDGSIHRLAALYLNPAQVLSDRGPHLLTYTGRVTLGAQLLLETGPGPRGSPARDWSVLGPVTIR